MDSDDDFTYHRHRSALPITLVAFYNGTGVDGRGRSLEQILQWEAEKLEASHDYIQTLFPLPEASGVNDRAPVINEEVFNAFRDQPKLRDRMRDAFKKMLWFYGFEMTDKNGKVVIEPNSDIPHGSQFWNTRFDHNHLRITRIIRCLRVLGLEEEALAFFNTMSQPSAVSARSKIYWERAAHRQLNLRPDLSEQEANEDDPRIGPRFLWRFEEAQKASQSP